MEVEGRRYAQVAPLWEIMFAITRVVVSFLLGVMATSHSSLVLGGEDDVVVFSITKQSEFFEVDLGELEAATKAERKFAIKGLKKSKDDLIDVVSSCGCLSTTIAKGSTDEVLLFSVSIATGGQIGKVVREIQFKDHVSSREIATLRITFETFQVVDVAPSKIDVTDMAMPVDLSLRIRDRPGKTHFAKAQVSIVGAAIEGAWLTDAGSFRSSETPQSAFLQIRGVDLSIEEVQEDKSLHQVYVTYEREGNRTTTVHQVLLTRKFPLRLLKCTAFDSGREEGKISATVWLGGSVGIPSSTTEMDAKLQVSLAESEIIVKDKLLFRRVGESRWICKCILDEEDFQKCKEQALNPEATTSIIVGEGLITIPMKWNRGKNGLP